MTDTVTTDRDFAESWQTWHDARERQLASPLGWLSITRREWLNTEPGRFDGLPGTWWFDGAIAHLRRGDGESLEERDFDLEPTGAGELIDVDDVHIEVARRGDGYILRVHEENTRLLDAFRGVPAFPADAAWVLSGQFEPYQQPRPVTVGAVVEGLAHVYISPGEIVVDHDGTRTRLIAFNGHSGGLNILFTDGTSGVSTYAANRSLAVAASENVLRKGGHVDLDFNRATNLPCAFTDLATCPLPPTGNRLPFDVTAGEKTPYERQ